MCGAAPPTFNYTMLKIYLKPWPGLLGEQVVGHLPQEISRLTWYIIVHGGVVTVKAVDVNYLLIIHC